MGMARKKCGLGFDCGSMMLAPGIDPGQCENYQTCGAALELSPEEEFELLQARQAENAIEWERIRLNRLGAAAMMLISRACPQTPESLGVVDIAEQINAKLCNFILLLSQFDGKFIAPESCEVHTYNVKRFKTYWYNKLTAAESIFEPAEKTEKVRVIHLSHDSDPRNIEARLGVERRNQLTQARTQLSIANAALDTALALLTCSSLSLDNEARTLGQGNENDNPIDARQ